MQEAMVQIMGHDDCNAKLNGEITGRMVCGQGELSSGEVTDACQGDSGGPLVCRNADGAYTLHGATSWGYGCASPSKPGVWARVFAVRGWIDQQTGGATIVQPTASTSQPISTPAPGPDVCSKQVGGACKQCVHQQDRWCKKNPWDDQCYGFCCEKCKNVCSGSPTCAAPSPTPSPPTPLLESLLAQCFMSGGTDAGGQCAEVQKGKFSYYKMSLGESSPNEWTLMFRANFKALQNSGCAVGFGKVCLAKGSHLKNTACKAGSGWNVWTVLVEGGKGTLYCNGEIIRELGYPGGYSVSQKCGFLVGGSSKNNCNNVVTRAMAEVQDMVLHEGNALPATPAPSMPASSPELESLAAGASARCFVTGMADIAAQCSMGSGNWHFFRLKVGAVTSANWKLVFEADVEKLKSNTPLVSFGNGDKWILKGSKLKQVNNCAAGSGWHLWQLVIADGKATLWCDGMEATRYNLPGGYSVPASCSFLIGGRYTKWNSCSKTAAGGKLEVRNVMLIEM